MSQNAIKPGVPGLVFEKSLRNGVQNDLFECVRSKPGFFLAQICVKKKAFFLAKHGWYMGLDPKKVGKCPGPSHIYIYIYIYIGIYSISRPFSWLWLEL